MLITPRIKQVKQRIYFEIIELRNYIFSLYPRIWTLQAFNWLARPFDDPQEWTLDEVREVVEDTGGDLTEE